MTSIAPTLQSFFTDRLASQRRVSPRTIASYRDSLKLLLAFVQQRNRQGTQRPGLGRPRRRADQRVPRPPRNRPSQHPRTRNLRLTAIRSLFTYAALRHPEHAALIQQVLAIPAKRFDKQLVSFLTEAEIDALLAASDLHPVGRPPRPGAPARRRANRAARLRADRAQLRRRHPRRRRQRPLPRQGPQAPGRPAHHAHPGRAAGLDDRTRRATRPAAVPDPHRTAPQRRRRPTPGPPARCHRRPPMPVHPAGQAAPPHPAAQLRHDPAARRRRHRRHRALARPRRHPLHQRLPARRHGHQTASPRPHHPRVRTARTLPPRRPAAGLPGKPVTMPSIATPAHPRSPPRQEHSRHAARASA